MNKTITRLLVNGKRVLRVIDNPDSLLFHLLLPSIAVLSYFIVFDILYKAILSLPFGVNSTFVDKSMKVWIPWTLITIIFSLYYSKELKGKNLDLLFKKSIKQVSAWDFLLLFLPMTPVVQYIFKNRNLLSPNEAINTFLFLSVLAIIFIFLLAVLFGFSVATRKIMFLGVSFVTIIFSMAAISHSYNWYFEGSTKLQWLFFFGGSLLLYRLSEFKDKKILYGIILVIFITNSSISFLSPQNPVQSKVSFNAIDNKLVSLVEGRLPKITPNIYLLVYDSYVSNETLLLYGIDNSAQETYLADKGFTLYPHTYSVASLSVATMSRVLNVSIDYYGNLKRATSGDGVVQFLLQNIGYKTYGVFPSDYFLEVDGSGYDLTVPETRLDTNILLNSILMGEFRAETGSIEISRENFLKAKSDIFNDVTRVRKFIYSHSDYPAHAQFSGACRSNEISIYKERLNIANAEMQFDINSIINNDPSAIIIIAGDHGPYLTKNCAFTKSDYGISDITRLDIQDRYGTFLAIQWPTGSEFNNYDEITVLQDLFPAIFAYIFQDVNILDAKIVSRTLDNKYAISGASVENNIISGGQNSGESLFEAGQ